MAHHYLAELMSAAEGPTRLLALGALNAPTQTVLEIDPSLNSLAGRGISIYGHLRYYKAASIEAYAKATLAALVFLPQQA